MQSDQVRSTQTSDEDLSRQSAIQLMQDYRRRQRPFVVAFNIEIDVDAHPIPANVSSGIMREILQIPIILNVVSLAEFDWVPGLEQKNRYSLSSLYS